MKHYLLLIGLLLVASCSPTYHDKLEERLQGKSNREQRIVLAQECASEIENSVKPEEHGNVLHLERMKEICEEMTGHKVDVTFPAASKHCGNTGVDDEKQIPA